MDGPSYTASGNVKCDSNFGNCVAVPLKVKWSHHIMQPFHAQENENRATQKLVYESLGSTIHNSAKEKESKCLSIDKQINKISYMHIIEYYLAIKRNGALICAIWENLENIMLTERSQSQRTI
jgi:hypothetical protein